MTEWPPVIALIITYERTNLALQTIRSIKERLDYPNVGFHIADDGSNPAHVPRLMSEIGGSYAVTVSNSARRGVGVNMNLGMAECLKRADFILWLEDDWVLPQSLDLKPCVELLHGHSDLGMIRLGRMSPGLHGECFSAAGKYWWRLFRNHGDAYTFSGNAALRHRRFCMTYGAYPEGLKPGETELWYCAKFKAVVGPEIVWPAWLNYDQTFQHIGDHQSYKYFMEREGMTAEQAAVRFSGVTA